MDDEIGNEVSRKIKAAIKAKLVELGAYVDDELPDYIMIMVANKRSKSQMDSDLALFLNNNTKIFTTWLHTVLEKLQQVTVGVMEKKGDCKKSKKRELSVNSKSSSSSADKKSKKKKKSKGKKQKKKHKKKKLKEGSDVDEKSAKKRAKKDKPDFIAKEVGRAIIGSLKEKHKTEDSSSELKNELVTAEPDLEKAVGEQKTEPEEVVHENSRKERSSGETTPPEPVVQTQDNNEELTVVAVKLINNHNSRPETTVMVPTRELLKEHDKLTETKEDGKKQAESEDSLETAEELRRQLLLSRTHQKLRERNIASRMRSNSPEIIVVEESVVTQPSELTVEKSKALSDSSKLSLKASTLGSPSGSSESPVSLQPKKVSNKQVASLIIKPADPSPPEVSSVIQVKPREFAPPEKQANKNLILKAVAAAERSVATKVLKPSDGKSNRQLFTRELREKRFGKLSVTVGQASEKAPEIGQDGTFISSKPVTKGKTESFIKGWLEEVEEAGRCDALIVPDDLNEASDEKPPKDPKIVVTIDALSDQEEEPEFARKRAVKVNCISDRFAKLSKNRELKWQHKEFLIDRSKKKISVDGESKNEKLIAELSMKFGKVDERITRKRSADNEKPAKLASKVLKHH